MIERIIRAEIKRYGRGFRRMLLVKWQGQKELTWEPRSELEQATALDEFEKEFGKMDNVGQQNIGVPFGPRSHRKKRKK